VAISFRLPECDEERMLMGWNQHPDWNTFFISNPGTNNKNQKETEKNWQRWTTARWAYGSTGHRGRSHPSKRTIKAKNGGV